MIASKVCEVKREMGRGSEAFVSFAAKLSSRGRC